jgi:DNA (cytosine-5)-methyltransferase 1
MITYIDLFAGAGGLSEGFIRNGFVPLAHIEADSEACLTLKTRTAFHHLRERQQSSIYFDYLRGVLNREQLYQQVPETLLDQVMNVEISGRTLDLIFKGIRKNMRRIGATRVDAIVGGPPCQPFSIVGRGALNSNKPREMRANLYRFFAPFLREFRPRLFAFENVPGLLSAKNGKIYRRIVSSIDDAGYHLEIKTLDAYDFGVLQQRRRLILIGWQKKLSLEYPEFPSIKNGFLVKELFADLPALKPAEDGSKKGYSAAVTECLSLKKLRQPDDVLTQHITRPHNERDREIYELTIRTWKSEHRRLKYPDLPARLKTRKNESDFLDRFKVVADDLPFSHTLLAHIAKDGHYYIHPSLRQRRSLSVREAARIQSFPDNYFFEGYRSSAFRNIGNAVPPLMAEKIAAAIKQMLT